MWFLLRGILNEIHYLGSISFVEVSHSVVELGEAGGHSSEGELGLSLGEPDGSITRPELRELDGNRVDLDRNSSVRSGSRGRRLGHPQADGQMLVS